MRQDATVTDPTDLTQRSLWRGGSYELAVRLGSPDAVRLQRAVQVLWTAAGLGSAVRRRPARLLRDSFRDLGSALRNREAALELVPTEVSGAAALADHLLGVAAVPGLARVAADVTATRGAADWLVLSVPLGALAELDPRVGGYPLVDDLAASRAWREPLEDWFAGIAPRLYDAVPFAHAVSGFEVSGYEPAEVTGGRIASWVPDAEGRLVHHRVESWS